MTSQEDKLDRPALAEVQRRRLRSLLDQLLPANRFYSRKFASRARSADVKDPPTLPACVYHQRPSLLEDQAATRPDGNASAAAKTSSRRTKPPAPPADRCAGWTRPKAGRAARLLGSHLPHRRHWSRRSLFFPFSFGPVPGLLDGVRGGQQDGLPVHAGWRHEHQRTAAAPSRT